ncbi:MAG TPA: MupA/Atu3671 family FMN-dependent luciferase-like monooxygenase, partial [Thermoanaerobaculia bacterium]
MSMPPDTAARDVLKKAYLEIKSLRSRLAESEDARSEPVAIVGLGCRFPGGANDAESFWSVLRGGVDAVGPVPPDRWDTEAFFDADPDAPGMLYTRHGAFVDGVDRFDAELFGISPVEASSVDPQQRLLLEVAWEALENAGIAPESLRATRTGVFVGLMYQDYLARQLREQGHSGIGPYLGTGSTFSAAAGRLSYVLGLQGPSMAVDTACSSSLVAVHLACQALRNRECDVALAGGANVMLTPEASINLSKARMLSATGRCRTFDASADGYIRGEGSGLIVLKRLSQARADGDRILGVVRGSAVNQDGRSNGLTAPNGSAQRALLREALEAARVTADDVEYVECHGTGTPLGDPIEVGALLDVYGRRSHETPFAIGSVKTNFGHLESAAGICGLIKALLVLRHREVPPHLHLTTVNPRIGIDGRPVVIPTTPTPWFKQAKPMAAVSAFGFVGTNAHVILEAFEDETEPRAAAGAGEHVLTLSAATEAAVRELRDRFARHLATTHDDLGDICFTANTGRSHLPYRIAVVARDRESMQQKLRDAKPQRVLDESPRVAFLVAGEGEQQESLEQWRAWGVEPSVVLARGAAPLSGEELLMDVQASTNLETLAALYLQGVQIDWRAFHAPRAPRKVALPTYAFQRERYWIKPAAKAVAAPSHAPATLLGTRLPQAPHQPDTFVWNVDLDPARRAYLFEHKLLGTAVWPISAQMQLAVEAARDALGVERCRVSAIDFRQTLYSSQTAVQVVLTRTGDAAADLRIYSRTDESSEWSLNTTARIEPHAATGARKTLALSMMFFAATEEDDAADRYRLIVESARFADRHGFRSVWVPERHFTNMGSLYPSPSVLHAALARETKHVRLMAGSVVVPLHNVARIAEEWAMVDNLSGGRVGISCASGWNPDDFVLAPGRYDTRYDDLYKGIETLRGLWRGETFEADTPHGKRVALRTYPTPLQPELPLWITAARSPESFRRAGALGANLLTHLLDQDVETLAGKIALYRAARAEHGFDPEAGIVSVMCHTFVAADDDTAQRLAKKPFCDYLKSSLPLLAGLAYSRGQNIDVHKLTAAELDEFVEFLYERFRTTRALIGTPESCRPLLDALEAAGVNEVACLLDFGPAADEVLAHLPRLASMQQNPAANEDERANIDAARYANCTREVPVEQFYASLSAAGVAFEGSLRGVASLAAGDREALARIAASSDEAVLLDASIQTALATLPQSANDPMRVPTHVRSVRVHAPLAGSLRAHGRLTAAGADGDADADVTIFDERGDVLMEIEGLHVKAISRPARADDDWFYEIAWSASAWPEPRRATARPWLILEDRGGVGRAFAATRPGAAHLFVQHGAVTEQLAPRRWTVDPRDGFARLLRQLDPAAYEGVLCLWPLDAASNEDLDVAMLEADQSLGVETVPALVQALAERGHVPPLWLVTRGAQPVTADGAALHVSQSGLWGLAGALAREH